MARDMTRDEVMRATLKHVRRVGGLLGECATNLIRRANCHDDSKFGPEEFDAFVEATPKLAGTTYGSDEYKENLRLIAPALKHHNANNRHHPEHHPNGVRDMDLLDMMEMLCDWKAASERHNDGDIRTSIIHNAKRFGYGIEFARLLWNTAQSMGWADRDQSLGWSEPLRWSGSAATGAEKADSPRDPFEFQRTYDTLRDMDLAARSGNDWQVVYAFGVEGGDRQYPDILDFGCGGAPLKRAWMEYLAFLGNSSSIICEALQIAANTAHTVTPRGGEEGK